MSDYARAGSGGATHFGDKDALTTGDSDKVIVGAQFDAEFNAILTAVNSKYDSADLASQAEAEASSGGSGSASKLLSPKSLEYWSADNDAMLQDIQAITGSAADGLLAWDQGTTTVKLFTCGAGLEFSGDTVNLKDAVAGAGLAIGSSIMSVGGGYGITANANDVQVTDVVAGVAQPVVITDGTVTFDLSSISTLDIAGVAQAADGILMSTAGTLKVLPMDKVGSKIVAASTLTIDADSEVNVIHVNAGASDYTATIEAEVTKDFPIGTEIGFICQSTGTITLAINSDTLTSLNSSLTVSASGGGAYAVKTASTVWSLIGDLE